jgi:hypothetical protein
MNYKTIGELEQDLLVYKSELQKAKLANPQAILSKKYTEEQLTAAYKVMSTENELANQELTEELTDEEFLKELENN